MNKRHQPRKSVPHLVAEISDGNTLHSGIVSNISHSGLVLDDISPEIKHPREVINLTMLSNDQSYWVRAIPRWIRENNLKTTIGLRVFSVPRNWYKFVDSFQDDYPGNADF